MRCQLRFSVWFSVILIAAFAAGYLFWQQTLFPGPYDLEPVNIIRNSNSNLPRDEVLRGWQTYRNEEYGFEVKYPLDWTPGNIPNAIIFLAHKESLSDDLTSESRLTIPVPLNLGSLPQSLSESTTFAIIQNSNFLIGGKKAVREVQKNTPTLYAETSQLVYGELLFSVQLTWTVSGNVASLGQLSNKQVVVATFDQILSTFKFIR